MTMIHQSIVVQAAPPSSVLLPIVDGNLLAGDVSGDLVLRILVVTGEGVITTVGIVALAPPSEGVVAVVSPCVITGVCG